MFPTHRESPKVFAWMQSPGLHAWFTDSLVGESESLHFKKFSSFVFFLIPTKTLDPLSGEERQVNESALIIYAQNAIKNASRVL